MTEVEQIGLLGPAEFDAHIRPRHNPVVIRDIACDWPLGCSRRIRLFIEEFPAGVFIGAMPKALWSLLRYLRLRPPGWGLGGRGKYAYRFKGETIWSNTDMEQMIEHHADG